MSAFLKRYGFLTAVAAVSGLVLVFSPQVARASFAFTGKNTVKFIIGLTPVFICIGLLDVWVPREAMMKVMGEAAGVRGGLISYALGVVTAVPTYALLPVAGMLLKKGCRIANVMIFIGASVSIRIPLLLFEIQSLGWGFTAVRFAVNICIVAAIAWIINRVLTPEDKAGIYEANR